MVICIAHLNVKAKIHQSFRYALLLLCLPSLLFPLLFNQSVFNNITYDFIFPLQPLWTPVLIFSNSPSNERSLVDSKAALTVNKTSSSKPSSPDELEKISYFQGDSNPITYRREFKMDFSCNFKLNLYPFDTQVNIFNLKLINNLII